MKEEIVNKVAKSGLITISLSSFLPDEKIKEIDLSSFLSNGVLKEKEFRKKIKHKDFSNYKNSKVCVFCSTETIIPMLAYMLITVALKNITDDVFFGIKYDLINKITIENIQSIKAEKYKNKKIIIKGCDNDEINESAYIEITKKIQKVASSIMFGEACSSVPVLKNNKNSEELNSIEKIVMRINQSEEKAKNAENEYNKLKKLKYIKANNQKTLVCTVEGFLKKYILVNINDANLTALLSKSHLKHDRYRSARNRYAIVGQFSRKTIKVGDALKACVEKVDMINQEVFLRYPKKMN